MKPKNRKISEAEEPSEPNNIRTSSAEIKKPEANSRTKIVAAIVILIIILAAAWYSYVHFTSNTPTETTTTIRRVTTTTSFTTTTEETTTTVDPLSIYPQMTLSDFEHDCNSPAVIENTIIQANVKINGILEETLVMRGNYGVEVPMEGTDVAEKPPQLDATGSTNYKIYGTPTTRNDSEFSCWMVVQKITP